MKKQNTLFHESWHRLANQKISLRSNVQSQRQLFRGTRWYILRDPFSNQFYRLRPNAYEFIVRLNSHQTVEEVWQEFLELNPEKAPGQVEVVDLLTQLYHANLLHYELPPDSEKLFERKQKKQQRAVKANLLNIMFFRVPLIDPDQFLKAIRFFINVLFGPVGAIVWVGMVGFALKLVIDNFSGLADQSQAILAPSNLFLLYISLVIIKTIHEFGHSFAVRRYGGEVHTMGVMFLIFNPVPYMDASAAWNFREKWKRVLVGASGMIFEIFIAGIAVVVWANTGPGVIHNIAYNMIFIASLSTLVFNINPLLRFDGYYILSDLLDIPNLHQKAREHLTYLLEKFVFGMKDVQTPATSSKMGMWLTVFGILSTIYRFIVFGTILFFVADRFLILGVIMAIICLITWVILPVFKFAQYILYSPKLERVRPRAMLAFGATVTFLVLFTGILPFPQHFKAPGILQAKDHIYTVNSTPGIVKEILVPSGTLVKVGKPLLTMENQELEIQLAEANAALEESTIRLQQAMQDFQADIMPIQSRIEYYTNRLERLKMEKENLTVKATISGVWVSPRTKQLEGVWINRGTQLGQVINDSQYYFVSVVSQQNVSKLFSKNKLSAEVKLAGQANTSIQVSDYKNIPMEQSTLPSSALGIGAGGDISVDYTDQTGAKTTEPFYEVRATLPTEETEALMHGRSGKIRFDLPWKPVALQGWASFRQLIQKRYQI